jgi:hypothetical protein
MIPPHFHALFRNRPHAVRKIDFAPGGLAKFCAIAAHLIRNEQIDLRSGDGFRGCRSAEEVLAR